MNRLIAFFEIPATDFGRAVKFYEQILGLKMETFEHDAEKMAFFPEEEGKCPGAISWTSEMAFHPSAQGVLISLSCDDMESVLAKIKKNGGDVIISKTKIEAEGRGFFSVFLDSEGNRVGLYSDK